ncbi:MULTISPECIES: RelA/SpoT family protein [Methyloversatilis]|jgi:GTP pyrophosphokinase|uniref:RelA/SpoT family protein n=1 Tax=Methyloversatilis TaxID=378210 RepID=UPI0003756A31|nr:bifunctional (p)ppGpp synthetase/guanosine-3',5'-bis(diphosphate) 3'-pyrophosphohydrolase [Methyloversatilis discipulorum]
MVSVVHSLSSADAARTTLELLTDGLGDAEADTLRRAHDMVTPLYAERWLGTGEPMHEHVVGQALICASLRLDLETRLAALLFPLHEVQDDAGEHIAAHYGPAVAELVAGLQRLDNLRLITRAHASQSVTGNDAGGDQAEVLRKMVLAMVADVRVVMLRLASRVQSLRWLTAHPNDDRLDMARESLDIYAPLANRLGVWQLKWELEDLSFRFLEPDTYKRIAKQLDEKRVEREAFIADAMVKLKAELEAAGIKAEIQGRPKHIYSIWNKMRAKKLEFSEVYDVRALRVLVDSVRDCYGALGIVHQLWHPLPREFDDYIAQPKGNNYQSLHTAVIAPDGRSLEVQIRTWDMHRHAEMGVAAHWRYKEGSGQDKDYDDKIAWLRQLLSWRDEIADHSEWVEQFKRAALDDTIYVLTPQGKVIDLPQGATPVDFAYRLHTDLGHRCRGARVNGQLVPLNTPLDNGQRVEIIAAKQGGPSRDWLVPQQGYITTHNARVKVRRWFAQIEEGETLAQGRAWLARELAREGASQTSLEELSNKLGYNSVDAMHIACAHGEVGPRAIHVALKGEEPPPDEPEIKPRAPRATGERGVLVEGVGKLLTQLGRCCKPAPPDPISGFVTRGRGVAIHRSDCPNYINMVARNPERVIDAQWGEVAGRDPDARFAADIHVEAHDRQGLLRDISEVLSREKINVTAVSTQSKAGMARMSFTVEIAGVGQIQKVLGLIRDVDGVVETRRG